MKKKRFAMLAVMLLTIISCMLMTGCGSGKAKTESQMKRVAEKTLQEKYGEEFEIHYVWSRDASIFYATCSPKSNLDVVFEAQVYKDGSGLFEDEYLQGLVSRQISDRFEAKLQEVFGEDCYVHTHFYFDPPTIDEIMEGWKGEVPSLDYFKNATVEDYYVMVEEPMLAVKIIINKEKLNYSKEKAIDEFDCFSELYENEPMKEGGFSCYFADEQTFNECKKYFQKVNKARGEFDNIVDGIIRFGFGFDEGKINKSVEEYIEVRGGLETNE